jgi:Undecaprenyl-phosphate glucose phosphotransferase
MPTSARKLISEPDVKPGEATPDRAAHARASQAYATAARLGTGVLALDDGLGSKIAPVVRLMDGVIVFVAGVASLVLAERATAQFGASPIVPERLFLIGFYALAVVNLLQLTGLYRPARLVAWPTGLVAAPALAIACLLVVPVALLLIDEPSYLPWGQWLGWAFAAAAGIAVARASTVAMTGHWRRSGRFRRRVVIVGDQNRVQDVLDVLEAQRTPCQVVAISTDRGRAADLAILMKQGKVDDVIVAMAWSDEPRMAAWLDQLAEYPVDVHLFPEVVRPYLSSRGLTTLGQVAMVRLGARPLAGGRTLVKELEDKLLAGLLTLFLSPVFLLVALAIKLDSRGPVLFRQTRYGFNNEVFTVFKFRSMYMRDDPGPLRQATRDDPRITRVGRILRKSSIDELPQLLNVLNGTMSLVGPRPHAAEHQTFYQHLVDKYRCRHRVKPGITGWAQINGFRGETATIELMRQRVQYDLEYIENWSLLLDLRILLLTPLACLRGTNAH